MENPEPELLRYIGSPGTGSEFCIRLIYYGYKLDVEKVYKRLKFIDITPKFDYYTLLLNPGFKEDKIPNHDDISVVIKSATLKISLFKGHPINCVPRLQEDKQESPVKYNYVAQTTTQGMLSFKPLKLSKENKSSLKLIGKIILSTSNVYCYSVRTANSAEWIFRTRKGKSFLYAERDLILTIEIPKGELPNGKIELIQSQPTFLKNGKEIEGFWGKILLRIKDIELEPWPSPILSYFELRPPLPFSDFTKRFKRATGLLSPSQIPSQILEIIKDELNKI